MEHKIIRGGGEYLPFARGCVTKLKRLGLSYASMTYLVGGATIKVRIAPGHEYIEITGGGYFVSVFPGVQCPETSPVSGPLPGVAGAALRTGTFPATTPIDAGYPSLFGKTRFGSSPYSKKFLRMGQASSTPIGVFPITVANRWGVIGGTSIHNDIYVDGKLAVSIDSPSPYGGEIHSGGAYVEGVGSGRVDRTWTTNSVRFTPCVNSGKTPVLACVVVSTEDSKYSQLDSYGYDISDTGMFRGESGQRSSGNSSIRIFRTTKSSDGTSGLQVINAATLPYTWTRHTLIYSVVGGGPLTLWLAIRDVFSVTNDVETSYLYRRWHATDKVSVAPSGGIFILRETSSVSSYAQSRDGYPEPPTLTAGATRGYALSFVSPAGAPMDNIATRDIGALGYIDGVFPSADGKRVMVYYGLSPGEMPTGDSPMFAPTAFSEHLDVYRITRSGDSYSFTLDSTIDLGSVTLRTTSGYLSVGVPEVRVDHYESKLHGATLEVNGFIWADRYCFVLDTSEFVAIPDFIEYPLPFLTLGSVSQAAKDINTGPEDDRTSYLAVAPDGRSATYVMFKSGIVAHYNIRKDALTGVHSITAGGTGAVPGGYTWGEDFSAKSVWFSHTPSAT